MPPVGVLAFFAGDVAFGKACHADRKIVLFADEADKLCDRIAIVDHGKLVALDSPLKLKASVPGKNIVEVSFSGAPANWIEKLRTLLEEPDRGESGS